MTARLVTTRGKTKINAQQLPPQKRGVFGGLGKAFLSGQKKRPKLGLRWGISEGKVGQFGLS
ncbi:MAG: hypothetical protein COT85_06430 [Chlamydiae bacterium CG10_big_fil_rev_8_21_14_0_10_42_34]|nr:MAG: hypothetical protein COT85_06430 [Chlamydiae bacterium CG10_big_fil_rev_8_21_14_0_10_42_34]